MGRSTVPLDRRGLLMATLGIAPLRVVECGDSLIDCRLLGIRCDDFEVRAANSFAPPFAHFLDDLAAHGTAKLGDEEAIVADGESPVSSTGFDHIP
jgi:hypothetical protein